MTSEQIFVLEAIVKKIILEPHVTIQNLKELCLRFKFGHIVNFDIDTTYFSLPDYDKKHPRVINMNFGKTFLFTSKPSVLTQLLESEPLEIGLYDGINIRGLVRVPWKADFPEMIKLFETIGMVKSCTMHESLAFTCENDRKTADVDVAIKMSCFGENVQTMFLVRQIGKNQEIIFGQRNTSKTFKCERFADERTNPLVAALYSGAADTTIVSSDIIVKENVSLTSVFEGLAPITVTPSAYQPPPRDDSGIDKDCPDNGVISLSCRPPEKKFLDFTHMLGANAKNKVKATITIPKDQVERVRSFLQTIENDETRKSNALELTAENISRKLCGNKDCPAVKKFKEYGIGPLAPGAALGTLYEFVEPPVIYGLSHTYGTLSNYGPFGVFSKPKHENEPFEPARKESDAESGKHCNHVRKLKTSKTWHSKSCPLRLRGGGEEDGTETNTMPISPIMECQPVMDQFDDILVAYKKALGPCGQAICPYAQNITEQTCKNSCDEAKSPQSKELNMAVDMALFDEPKRKTFPAACGSPLCAYAKYKIGLLDQDAELELQFLPPPLQIGCGDPKCKYPMQPELPPIHWDCPDPLPKGQCMNPNCPFLPKMLRRIKTKEVKKAPCGRSECPFSQQHETNQLKCEEDICENPECPFANENTYEERDGTFKGEFQECGNPECPYKGSKTNDKKKQSRRQTNPEKRKKSRTKNSSKVSSVCSNPECYYNKHKSKSSVDESICSNPKCPYKTKIGKGKIDKTEKDNCFKEGGNNICSNTDCPERIIQDSDYCAYAQTLASCRIPNCIYESISGSFYCENPTCPLKKTDFQGNDGNGGGKEIVEDTAIVSAVCDHKPCEDRPGDECDNPDCGFTIEERKKKGKRGRKKRSKFVYTIGDVYPGTKLGHKECVTPNFMVPPNMGWLWNIWTPMLNLKPRRGWRPGALSRIIAQRIRAHRQSKGLGIFELPNFKDGAQCDEVKVVPKPTLQIQKKEGCYWITMNPLKDPRSLTENEDPYMECTPMTFKISKNKKQDDICYCDEAEEKQSSSSSNSELDIEFTPPAGIIHPERFKKKPDVVCCASQYDPVDFEISKKKEVKDPVKKEKGKKETKAGKKGKTK